MTERLSRREQEIAGYVASGLNNREIARRAAISEGTVKAHLMRIFEKLRIRDRTQLAAFYERAVMPRPAGGFTGPLPADVRSYDPGRMTKEEGLSEDLADRRVDTVREVALNCCATGGGMRECVSAETASRGHEARLGVARIPVIVAAGRSPWGAVARRRLKAAPGIRLLAEVSDTARALGLVGRLRRAVVVIDREIPEAGSLALTRALRMVHPSTRVLVVVADPDSAFTVEAVMAGGHGAIPAPALARQLPKAVRTVAAGEIWLSRRDQAHVLEALWQASRGELTRPRAPVPR